MGEVKPSQPSQLSQTRGELAGESVVSDVECAKKSEVGEIGGERSGDAVGVDTEYAELCEPSDGVLRDGSHQSHGGETEIVDMGPSSVARDSDPVADRVRIVPLETRGVWNLGEEVLEGLFVLSRLRVGSLTQYQQEEKITHCH